MQALCLTVPLRQAFSMPFSLKEAPLQILKGISALPENLRLIQYPDGSHNSLHSSPMGYAVLFWPPMAPLCVCFICRTEGIWAGLVARSTQSLKQGSKNYMQQ